MDSDKISVLKSIRNTHKILKILCWKLLEKVVGTVSGWRVLLRQFCIHNHSVTEEYQWSGECLTSHYKDHFIQLAPMLFLSRNQLMKMSKKTSTKTVSPKKFSTEHLAEEGGLG